MILLIAECWFLRRGPAECALRLLGEALKGTWVLYRNVGKYFAVQFNTALFQAIDELAVAHPVKAGRGSDADDPQGTELTLFLAASRVGEFQPAFDRFFCGTVQFQIGGNNRLRDPVSFYAWRGVWYRVLHEAWLAPF